MPLLTILPDIPSTLHSIGIKGYPMSRIRVNGVSMGWSQTSQQHPQPTSSPSTDTFGQSVSSQPQSSSTHTSSSTNHCMSANAPGGRPKALASQSPATTSINSSSSLTHSLFNCNIYYFLPLREAPRDGLTVVYQDNLKRPNSSGDSWQ